MKRITCVTRRPSVTPAACTTAWQEAAGALGRAPHDVRPLRVTLCHPVEGMDDAGPRHDLVAFEWFRDGDHLERLDAWRAGEQETDAWGALGRVVDLERSPVILADEVVLRGATWLAERWRGGAPVYKHIALAVRADGLSPHEFSSRWRSRAGVVSTSSGSVTEIPADVRGDAYVQNHPVDRTDGEWAYDAVNEVYFDELAALRARAAWFRGYEPEADLFARSWFLATRETLCAGAR